MVSGASTAALVSEEKGPSLVSQYQALAPEEVGGRSKGTFKLKEERTVAEIKRDRRAIKQKIKGILNSRINQCKQKNYDNTYSFVKIRSKLELLIS